MPHIQVRGPQKEPIAFMNCRVSEGAKPPEHATWGSAYTDKAGNIEWPMPYSPVQRYALHFNYADVNPLWVPLSYYLLETDREDVFITLERAPFHGTEHGWIRAQDRDFIDERNEPWQFRGYTVHYAINAMFDDWRGPDSIDDVIDEAIELGANTIVTIGMHASPWKTANGWRCTPIEHPDYFVKLANLFDRGEDKGMRFAHAVWADKQHLPATFPFQWFWEMSCSVMRGRPNVFARKGNESRYNGWKENDFIYPDMAGVLCSQGSKGGKLNPHYPYLDFVEYEVRRDLPKMFLDVPLRQMMDGDFQGPATNRPTINIEPIFFHDTNPDHVGDERSTDPRVALELGMMMGACAGGAIGLSDALECKRLKPHARHIASEFFRGQRAAFVRPLAALDFQGQH